MDDEPRKHHYLFAHRVLPALVLTQWESLRQGFRDGSAADRLRSVWVGLGTKVPPDERIAVHGLDVEPIEIGGGDAFLVTMPTPAGPTEAALAMIPDRDAPTRYFVLELGLNVVTDEPYWVLCEWTLDEHTNFGACGEFQTTDPTNVRGAMQTAVAEALEREREPGGKSG